MKTFPYRFSFLLLMGSLSLTAQGETLPDALQASKVNLDLRTVYFDRNFDKPGMVNAKALTFGGMAKVETGAYQGFQVGVAYYGNMHAGVTERRLSSGTSLLENPTNDDLSYLGEAYAKYHFGQSSLQLGRQKLATPLANDRDLRALPTTYRAAVLRSREVQNVHLETGWITGSSEFAGTANGFTDSSALWGRDGLGYVFVDHTPLSHFKWRAQYARSVDPTGIKVRDYRYADLRFAPTPETFIEAQYAGNAYDAAKDSLMFGVQAGMNFSFADVALAYNKIQDNAFRAIQAGPLYTDWQQGYANYEPSEALGAYVVFKPVANLSLKLGSVRVSARESSTKDDYAEHILDAIWTIDSSNRLRVRYSQKDLTDRAYVANPTYPDRSDLRIIYSRSFSN